MSDKVLTKNGIMSLANIYIKNLPIGFKCEFSLDLTNSLIKELPKKLSVKNDLILGNSGINKLPEDIFVGGNIITDLEELNIPDTTIIGGKIITKNKEFFPEVNKNNIIYTLNGDRIVFNYKKNINKDLEMVYYKNANPWSMTNAIKYRENYKTFVIPCSGLKDGVQKVELNRAKIRGIYEFSNYDINELRSVEELEIIYWVCTNSCVNGIKRFKDFFNIDENKKYSIKYLIELIKSYKKEKLPNKDIFLNLFDK